MDDTKNLCDNSPERYQLIDQIISAVMSNVLAEKQRNDKIILYHFDINNNIHRLYFNAALIIGSISNEPIYIECSLWNYIRLKIKKWSFRKQIKHISAKKAMELRRAAVSIDMLMDYVQESFGLSKEEMDKINDQVYGW